MKSLVIASCCLALLLPPAATAQQTKQKGKKSGKPARVKVEKLACRLGTEDEHARIAVQLADGKVDSFAYYSKWKPQTCSMDVKRGDAFSTWEDAGSRTVVTLFEGTGAFLIEHGPGRYHFIFRDIDRMRYCGMEGKVSGTLTVFKGRPQCVLEGVMNKDGSELGIQSAGSPGVETKPSGVAQPALEARPGTPAGSGETQAAEPATAGTAGAASAAKPATAGTAEAASAAKPATTGTAEAASTAMPAAAGTAGTTSAAEPATADTAGAASAAEPATAGTAGGTPAAKPATAGTAGGSSTAEPATAGTAGSPSAPR